jgi:hypothetical protein
MASLEDERIERDPVAPGETDLDNAPRELPAYLKGLVRAPKSTRRTFPVDTKLPSPSEGVYGYYEEKHRYGIKEPSMRWLKQEESGRSDTMLLASESAT